MYREPVKRIRSPTPRRLTYSDVRLLFCLHNVHKEENETWNCWKN